jgi:hypothetical protein
MILTLYIGPTLVQPQWMFLALTTNLYLWGPKLFNYEDESPLLYHPPHFKNYFYLKMPKMTYYTRTQWSLVRHLLLSYCLHNPNPTRPYVGRPPRNIWPSWGSKTRTRDSKADLCYSQNNCQIEHNLFICPFVTPFGFGSCGLRLGSSLFVLPFPLCWVLCFMELISVSSSLPNSRDSPVMYDMAKGGSWHGLLTMVWHRLGLSSLQNPLPCHRNWIAKPHLCYKTPIMKPIIPLRWFKLIVEDGLQSQFTIMVLNGDHTL